MITNVKKAITYSGQDLLLTPFDIEFANRCIYISGEINDELATSVNSALRCLARESEEDITMYIQSPGGSISSGLSIYDTARSLKCDVITVSCGMAASMGAFLLTAAGTRGKRWCQPNSEVLIHQPLGATRGQTTDIRIQAEHMLNVRVKLNKIFSECTGQSLEKIENDTERDYILSAEEACEYGLVDHVGDPFGE